MDQSGSELHLAGFPAPLSVVTLKDDESLGDDYLKDFTHDYPPHSTESSALDAPVSVISLTDDEFQRNDSPRCEDLTHVHAFLGPELQSAGLYDSDASISGITQKYNEPQGEDCPKYEDLIHDGKFEPPPPYVPPQFPSAPELITIPTSVISEDTAREALLAYAKKKCCYSTGPAQQMLLKEFQPFHTFRYRLDTFTETRICKWVSEPYYDEEVDGPENGPPPNPWDLQAHPPNLFQKAEYYIPLPHTSSVMTCSQCSGFGRNMCINCFGTGRSRCAFCGGSGWSTNQRCISCGGMGRVWCFCCSGSGYQRCITCCGKGKLIKYIKLTVKWENHNFEFIADHKSDFPTKRFNKVTGEWIFSDEQQMIPPVTSFPEPSIIEASENVISQHRAEFTHSKILRQRHSIEWLPLTQVNYTWNGSEYDFFVYGKENKAYAKQYPKRCCCAIM